MCCEKEPKSTNTKMQPHLHCRPSFLKQVVPEDDIFVKIRRNFHVIISDSINIIWPTEKKQYIN